MGIALAFCALIGWGFGDFFIQRSVRHFGVLTALAYIGLFAGIVLLPFVWHDIPATFADIANIKLLGGLGLLTLACAIIEFTAFGEGKIAVLEPILSSELPITVILGVAVLGEVFSLTQALLMIAVFVGISLVATLQVGHLRHRHILLERGTLLALFSVLGLAAGNILVAIASREISPLMTIWSTFLFIGLASLLWLLVTGQASKFTRGLREHPILALSESFFDTFGWLAFAYATTYTSVAVATTISESYVLIAVALGIIYNREKLKLHQVLGIPLALAGVLLLSSLAS